MTKFKYYVSMTTIALAIGLLLYGYYLVFFPFEPVTLNKSPMKIFTKEVKPGGILKYEMDFTKNNSNWQL